MSLVLRTFKWEFISILVNEIMDIIFRLGFSVAILYLFEAVVNRNLTLAYIFAAVLVFCWYLSQLFKQTADTESYLLASHIKGGFLMLLYSKVSKLTSYIAKSS